MTMAIKNKILSSKDGVLGMKVIWESEHPGNRWYLQIVLFKLNFETRMFTKV
jgi:hypothetical protein